MHSACIFIFFQISQSMIQNDFFSRFFSFCIIKNLFYIILFFFLLLSVAVVAVCPLTHLTVGLDVKAAKQSNVHIRDVYQSDSGHSSVRS